MPLLQEAPAHSTSPLFDSRFRLLLDVMPVAAYTCDAEGLITSFNRRAVAVWGREPKLNDPVDRYCGSFKLFAADGVPIPHDRCWMALALLENQGYNEQEIVIERPDGSRRTALAHANPFYDEFGDLAGAVNILLDITERKQAEDALREADRHKSEFLAMLAHELRNPLAPLRNGLQILRLAKRDAATLQQAQEMMERQLGHMVRLIDDLLDLSRITNGKIELRQERIDLEAAVNDALETSRPLIEAAGHELKVVKPSRPIWVLADQTRLAQVFANLLNNSARYTERGGHIRLTIERQGSDVLVKVRDDGIGIPADVMARVFDMFAQADRSTERAQGGLGIGLSVVRRLVEMHGGRVEATSEGPGMGSEFIVRLPLLLSKPREGTLANGAGDDRSRDCAPKCRILVVDDNADSANSLKMILQVLGYEVRCVYDGAAAVAEAEAFRPAVVLLDIGLPKMSGYEACRRIREQPWGQEVVLIAQTGWGQEDDKQRAREAGFHFHLVKPVDPYALEKMLAGLLQTPA